MSARNLAACDQCHRQKLKCIPLTHGCARCKHLHMDCTSERVKQKRGRKAVAVSQSSATPDTKSSPPEYPVLNCLVSLGICSLSANDFSTQKSLCSVYTASRLLEHHFTSPNQEWHTRVIRRVNLLGTTRYRATSPALLCSILCMACYMPCENGSPILPNMSNSGLVALRRALLSKVLKLVEPVILGGDVKPTIDDAITSFLLTNIGPSENETEVLLTNWLSFHKFLMKEMGVYYNRESMEEETLEEWRRLWWVTYVIDRHTSLSFNTRPQMTDVECQELEQPVPEKIWESTKPLSSLAAGDGLVQPRGVPYIVSGLDMFGLILPLSRILGNILEYQFLRHHSTFSSSESFIAEIKNRIERSLFLWNESLQQNLAMLQADTDETLLPDSAQFSDAWLYIPGKTGVPKVVLYAKHIYHCMFILLYGSMDFLQMYNDFNWHASPDFLKAADNANCCAQLAGSIIASDNRLLTMYRFFGTYFLQSSFIFLILAHKLGNGADDLIIKNCSVNLQVLDAFVSVVNIDYQRTYARLLRDTIEKKLKRAPPRQLIEGDPGNEIEDVKLDPFFYKIRWVAGHNGLRGGSTMSGNSSQ